MQQIEIMKIEILSLSVLISAVIAIFYRQRGNINLYSVFKPLTTILIIIIGVIAYQKSSNTYTSFILASLFFCLSGDIFLINKKYFLYGLFSFLIAHIGFLIGFTSLNGFQWNFLPIIILLAIGGSYYFFLFKDLKKYAIPVAIYISVILLMNLQAIGLLYYKQSYTFFGIAIASILFSFSDSIIAYNKFKKQFKLAEILILSTYWLSIYTFTISGINI